MSAFKNRTRKLFVVVPVLHITEKIVDDVIGLPQERVQNRVTRTGKVFTVHHRGDQVCAVDIFGLEYQGSGQVQHASTWRCDAKRQVLVQTVPKTVELP